MFPSPSIASTTTRRRSSRRRRARRGPSRAARRPRRARRSSPRVAEGAAVAGQAEVDSSGSTSSRLARNSPTGSGRVAVVEEEDGAAEQVVAGDQQPALGLVEDDVRGRVAGRLVDLPGAEVGLDLDPGTSSRSGSTIASIPVSVAAARLAVALQRRRRDAALARDLDPAARAPPPGRRPAAARAPRPGASRARSRRASTIGAGEAVVVGVGVGADEQPHVLDPEPAWASARSSWRSRPLPPIPVSKRTMPSPRATAQALPCGTPGQGRAAAAARPRAGPARSAAPRRGGRSSSRSRAYPPRASRPGSGVDHLGSAP